MSGMGQEANRVLVVDGDKDGRGRTSAALERAGYATRQVGTGAAALEALREKGIALVLLEVALPDMTGYEICRQIREELGEGLPVFFVSGIRTEPLDRVAGLLLGADDFIVKPYDADELVARVRRFVNRKAFAHAVAAEEARTPHLTRRELEVLGLLIDGRRQKEIAAQ